MADGFPPSVTIPCTAQNITGAGPPPPTQLVPDEFFNMTLISFQVENTLFRVNKHGFNVPGTTFEAMFSLLSSETHGEGSNNENPIHLSGIKAEDFRAFLRALYPFKEQPPMTGFEDWMGVLTLATRWDFTRIRSEAIAAVSVSMPKKSIPQRIYLGRKFNVTDWIRDAYVELLGKSKFTLEELSEDPEFPLDWRTIAKILHIRDVNYSNRLNLEGSFYHDACKSTHKRNSCPWGIEMPVFHHGSLDRKRSLQAVNEVFRDELEVNAKDATADKIQSK